MSTSPSAMARLSTHPGKDLRLVKREHGAAFFDKNIADIQATACEYLADGQSLKVTAEAIGISPSTLRRLRVERPEFREALERAAFEGADAILDLMRNTPWVEEDASRARVKIDALCRYLELRWPDRYGKRLDVTVKTLDLSDALTKARARASITIESTACVIAEHVSETDCESVSADDSALGDPFG